MSFTKLTAQKKNTTGLKMSSFNFLGVFVLKEEKN